MAKTKILNRDAWPWSNATWSRTVQASLPCVAIQGLSEGCSAQGSSALSAPKSWLTVSLALSSSSQPSPLRRNLTVSQHKRSGSAASAGSETLQRLRCLQTQPCGAGAKAPRRGWAPGVSELHRPLRARSYPAASAAILIWKAGGARLFCSCTGLPSRGGGALRRMKMASIPLLLWPSVRCWLLTCVETQCTFSWRLSLESSRTKCYHIDQDTVRSAACGSFCSSSRRDEVVLWEEAFFFLYLGVWSMDFTDLTSSSQPRALLFHQARALNTPLHFTKFCPWESQVSVASAARHFTRYPVQVQQKQRAVVMG